MILSDNVYSNMLQIWKIDATKSPPLYYVKNLLHEKRPGSLYQQQLRPAPTPGKYKF